jgi:predicted AAA+ superfamily ATPase
MHKETLKYIFTDFQEKELPETKPRELELPILSSEKDSNQRVNKIISLSGVRRCGKTFLFYHTMRKLIDSGIINLENSEDNSGISVALYDLAYLSNFECLVFNA